MKFELVANLPVRSAFDRGTTRPLFTADHPDEAVEWLADGLDRVAAGKRGPDEQVLRAMIRNERVRTFSVRTNPGREEVRFLGLTKDSRLDRNAVDLRMDAVIAARPDLVPRGLGPELGLQDRDDWFDAVPDDIVSSDELDELFEAAIRQERVLRALPAPDPVCEP